MMLTWRSPGQSRSTLSWASRNSWLRPGFTLKRTVLNAVMWSSLVCRCARAGAAGRPPCPRASGRRRSPHGGDRGLERLAVVAVLLDEVLHLLVAQPVLLAEIAHFAGIARGDPAAVGLAVRHHPLSFMWTVTRDSTPAWRSPDC